MGCHLHYAIYVTAVNWAPQGNPVEWVYGGQTRLFRHYPGSQFTNWNRVSIDPLTLLPQAPNELHSNGGIKLFSSQDRQFYYRSWPDTGGFPPAPNLDEFNRGYLHIDEYPGVIKIVMHNRFTADYLKHQQYNPTAPVTP